jgi:hypothetical protein
VERCGEAVCAAAQSSSRWHSCPSPRDVAAAAALLTSLHHLIGACHSTCIGYVRNLTPVAYQRSPTQGLPITHPPSDGAMHASAPHASSSALLSWCCPNGSMVQPGWKEVRVRASSLGGQARKKSVLITKRALVARHATTRSPARLCMPCDQGAAHATTLRRCAASKRRVTPHPKRTPIKTCQSPRGERGRPRTGRVQAKATSRRTHRC